MRLALLYHQFITRGGLEGYLRAFVTQLKKRGHEIELVGSKFDPEFRALADRVHCIKPPPFLSGWMLRRFAARSAELIPQLQCDITLGFGRTFRQDIHRAGGGCHKVYSRLLPERKRAGWKNQLELKLEQQLYTGGQTKHFVVNASRIAEELQTEYGVAADRITVIPTGVDTDHYQPGDKVAARFRISSPSETKPVLLFVSLDHKRKGLPALLQAMPLIPEAQLWIVGAPVDAYWQQEIARMGLTSRVTAFGKQADLRPFYQAADVFVHPTLYDACANTVLQSMASGLPGVISSHDGARDFIHHGENGFLLSDPTSPEEIAHHVQQALGADLGAAARKMMLPLTWDYHVDRWLDLINEVRS